jgi:predicted GNAT family acetyltransferase
MRRMLPLPDLRIEHRPEQSRFQAVVQGRLCVAGYRLTPGVMHMTHTEVPTELEGRGIAAALVAAALVHAKANGLKVEPLCSYVRAYMRRHPETLTLLA